MGGELGVRSQHPRWEPVFPTGIVLSDDVCQLMLIRYGRPDLQMDFVNFVHLMLRVENMEGELVGRRVDPGFLCSPRGLPTYPQFKQKEDGCQCRELWGCWLCFCETWLHLPKLTDVLPVPGQRCGVACLEQVWHVWLH